MRRLEIIRYTGTRANNLKIAARLSRKLLEAIRHGECLLLDFEGVEPTQDFLDALLKHARGYDEKVKFCGLPIMRQITMALKSQEREELH